MTSVESAESASPQLIAVPAEDYKRYNAAMLRLLICLYDCGSSLPTVKLFKSSGMSTAYGGKILRKAEDLGYVKRTKVRKPTGKSGNDMIVNTLTTRGTRLLETLNLT